MAHNTEFFLTEIKHSLWLTAEIHHIFYVEIIKTQMPLLLVGICYIKTPHGQNKRHVPLSLWKSLHLIRLQVQKKIRMMKIIKTFLQNYLPWKIRKKIKKIKIKKMMIKNPKWKSLRKSQKKLIAIKKSKVFSQKCLP